jgi:hypothetical protein
MARITRDNYHGRILLTLDNEELATLMSALMSTAIYYESKGAELLWSELNSQLSYLNAEAKYYDQLLSELESREG